MAANPPGPVVAPKPRARWRWRGRGWKFYVLVGVGVPFLILAVVFGYFYVSFSRMIDARLHGEMQRADPRVYARPFQLRRGQSLTPTQIIDRLNDLGYSHRARSEQPGEFTVGRDAVLMIPRDGDRKGQLVRIVFGARGPKGAEPTTIDHIDVVATKKTVDRLTLDPPLITALITSAREKRRDVPLAAIPERMIQAVLAIEDRRFYDHAGVDPIAHRRRDCSTTSSAARRTCAAPARSRSSWSRTPSSRRSGRPRASSPSGSCRSRSSGGSPRTRSSSSI